MPELPEVEVVRRGLAGHVLDRTISEVEVAHPRAVRRHAEGGMDFAGRLIGRTVTGARRRGKYLWLDLDGGGPGDDAVLARCRPTGMGARPNLLNGPCPPVGRHRWRSFCAGW